MKATGIHEYTRKCRMEGGLLARSVFLIVLYAFLVFVTLTFTLIFPNIVIFFFFGGIAAAVFFITKSLFSESRDYEIVDGSFRIYKVYGNSMQRKVFEHELREMLYIAPYRSDDDVRDAEKVYAFLSDTRSNDAYYALFSKNGTKCAVIFDGDEKFYRAAAFYAARAFVR